MLETRSKKLPLRDTMETDLSLLVVLVLVFLVLVLLILLLFVLLLLLNACR